MSLPRESAEPIIGYLFSFGLGGGGCWMGSCYFEIRVEGWGMEIGWMDDRGWFWFFS